MYEYGQGINNRWSNCRICVDDMGVKRKIHSLWGLSISQLTMYTVRINHIFDYQSLLLSFLDYKQGSS